METAVTVVGAGDVAANISHKTTCVTNPGHPHSGHNHQHEALSMSGRRRALVGNAATAGFMAAAVAATVRRGRLLGFKKLFHSISAPKDIVYIGALYGVGDISQQLITQSRRFDSGCHVKTHESCTDESLCMAESLEVTSCSKYFQ